MERFRICIISPPGYKHAYCFLELAVLLSSSLRDLGIDCDTTINDLSTEKTNIILGGNLIRDLSVLKGIRYIPYQLEQLSGNPNLDVHYLNDFLGDAAAIWDYSPENISFLENKGLKPVHVPIGYHQNLEQIPKNLPALHDVLFYGSIGQRRKETLDSLDSRGVKVKSLFGIYGQERDLAIAQSKIVLNIHYYPVNIFEAVRISYLLNNGIFTISEESSSNPYSKIDLCLSPYERLVETCLDMLNNEPMRKEMQTRCYEQFRSHYPMVDLMKRAIGL